MVASSKASRFHGKHKPNTRGTEILRSEYLLSPDMAQRSGSQNFGNLCYPGPEYWTDANYNGADHSEPRPTRPGNLRRRYGDRHTWSASQQRRTSFFKYLLSCSRSKVALVP